MKEEMNNELKMMVHEIIEHATQALMRNDSNNKHWKVLLSLLRYKATEYVEMYQRLEKEEEE